MLYASLPTCPRSVIYHCLRIQAGRTNSPLPQLSKGALKNLAANERFSTATSDYQPRSQFLKDFLAQPSAPLYPSRVKTQMASDEDYGNFLDKANQDTGSSKASAQSTSKPSTKSVDTEVPNSLQKVEQYYTSEADEPFEPVSLKWDGKDIPSESTLRS